MRYSRWYPKSRGISLQAAYCYGRHIAADSSGRPGGLQWTIINEQSSISGKADGTINANCSDFLSYRCRWLLLLGTESASRGANSYLPLQFVLYGAGRGAGYNEQSTMNNQQWAIINHQWAMSGKADGTINADCSDFLSCRCRWLLLPGKSDG